MNVIIHCYALVITFVNATNCAPVKYLIIVNKQDDIKKVKSKLIDKLQISKHPDMLVVAEVFNKHISKILVSILISLFNFYLFRNYW